MISLALVLALGALGVAYAPWTDEVEITQTVETGSLEIGVRGWADLEGDTKDYVDITVTEGESKFFKNTDEFFASVTIDIDNLYPSVWVHETFEIAIGGTVPVYLYPTFSYDDEDGLFDADSMTINWRIFDADGEEVADGVGLDALAEALPDHQAYPCEIITIEIDKHLEQHDGENMNLDGSFTITIKAVQYNYDYTP